jgi:hypothetical protein
VVVSAEDVEDVVFGSSCRLKVSFGGKGVAEADVGRPKGRNHGKFVALADSRRLELVSDRCGSCCDSFSVCSNSVSTERGCGLSSYGGCVENFIP